MFKTKMAPSFCQGCVKLRIGPRAVPARSGRERKKATEGPAPKPIPTRCEPGRLAVRELDAARSFCRISLPVLDGGAAKPFHQAQT
jgi:hypothetical protein